MKTERFRSNDSLSNVIDNDADALQYKSASSSAVECARGPCAAAGSHESIASIDQLFLEQIIGKAFLRLEAVVLTPRHGEGNADARLDVQELAQGGQAVGVDQQRVVLHFDVVVQDRQRLVELTHRQFRARQLLF